MENKEGKPKEANVEYADPPEVESRRVVLGPPPQKKRLVTLLIENSDGVTFESEMLMQSVAMAMASGAAFLSTEVGVFRTDKIVGFFETERAVFMGPGPEEFEDDDAPGEEWKKGANPFGD